MPKTLTRADLSASVYNKIGLSLQECNSLVDSVIEEVCISLEQGDSVKLSSFGTFNLRKKKQRMGRNPKTGIEVPITSRTVLSFNASNLLKNRVNAGMNDPQAESDFSSQPHNPAGNLPTS